MYLYIESIYPSGDSRQGGSPEGLIQGSTDLMVCSVRHFAPNGRSKIPLSRPISQVQKTCRCQFFCCCCSVFTFPVSKICYFSQVNRIPVPRLCLPVDLHGSALQDPPNQQYYPTINTEIPLGTSLCTQVSSEKL